MTSSATPPRTSPSSVPILRLALRWSLLLGGGLLVVLGIIGALVAGTNGVLSAVVGVAISIGFMAITVVTILLGNRFAGTDAAIGGFFGIVMGGWLVKFVVFIVTMVLLRGASWVVPGMLFASLLAGILGSLLVDVMVLTRARLPYVSDVKLPSSDASGPSSTAPED